jgi:hypothetical protein
MGSGRDILTLKRVNVYTSQGMIRAYDELFDGFAPASLRRRPQARQSWAVDQLLAICHGWSAPDDSAPSATVRSISPRSSPSSPSTIFADGRSVEWECAPKHPEDGAREGARFVRQHLIRTTDRAFDDFAGSPEGIKRRLLGLDRTPWEGVHVAVGKPQAYYEEARPAGRSRRRRARMPGS